MGDNKKLELVRKYYAPIKLDREEISSLWRYGSVLRETIDGKLLHTDEVATIRPGESLWMTEGADNCVIAILDQ